MTALLPDPVPLDPPPGDPRALDDLAGRLHRAADQLGDLGGHLAADAVATPSWAGADAAAATARVQRGSALAHDAAEALRRAGTRVALHRDLLEEARARLARLRAAQEEEFGAAALRLGGVVDLTDAAVGAEADGAFDDLWSTEAARRRVAESIREDIADDAAATAVVLADCSAVAGGGGGGDATATARYLAALLPGWHEAQLEQRGRDFADALLAGDDVGREEAARELLPWADDGAVAAAVLTGLGADGLRAALRELGDGSFSAASALARVLAAVLGAPVPPADADAVARVRNGRHVDPDDHRTLDSDLVALGMGVVLVAGRGSRRAGPPLATVREWGRQIIARERATGAERIVDRVRLPPSPARPGDPLQEVLVRLAEADDPAAAATFLGAQPDWSHLLARPWDDDGAAFGALVARAGEDPGPAGETALRSGLRALATGLGDDGDPAGWTVDRGTAAEIGPHLAEAVAARPDVVTGPLARAAAGEGGDDRLLLRGLGYLSSEPAAAVVLDRGLGDAVARLGGLPESGGLGDPAPAVAVAAGYPAVQEYGQRLAHALDGFAAQEQAERRAATTEVFKAVTGPVASRGIAVAAVLGDLDGTWDGAPEDERHYPGYVVSEPGAPGAAEAYANVAALLGAPTTPVSPPTDWLGLVTDLLTGGGRLRDIADFTGDVVQDLRDDDERTEVQHGGD